MKADDVNVRDMHGRTPLMEAASRCWSEEVKKLIKDGADVNATNPYGESALMMAVMERDSESVLALIEAGADVNVRSESKSTALMWAAGMGDSECLNLLIQGGADLEIRDMDGDTALMMAAGARSGECLELLLEAGADFELTNHMGQSMDDLARESPACHEVFQSARASRRAAELDLKLNQACDSWTPPEASSSTHKGPQAQQEKLTQAEHQAPVARSRQRF